MNSLKYCHHCGKQLDIAAHFCSKCGTSLASLSNKPEPVVIPQKAPLKRPNFVMPLMGRDGDEDDDDEGIQHFELRMNGLDVDVTNNEIVAERMEIGLPPEKRKAGRPKRA